jgi:hypothetical protein
MKLNIKDIMMLLIKTIMSVLKALTYIITSIADCPTERWDSSDNDSFITAVVPYEIKS